LNRGQCSVAASADGLILGTLYAICLLSFLFTL
jgi:hypothetical protein